MINLILLFAKSHIHKAKFLNSRPSFLILDKEIKQYIDSIKKSKNQKAIETMNVCALYNIFK